MIKINTYPYRIGVAVSGGIDSMVLLHAFIAAKQNVLVLNVEHGIRGIWSQRDTDFVRSYCLLNNIPFLSKSVNAPENCRQGESIETCARRLRYEFFEETLASGKVQKIALAHHADDNAETVLMRIFRGTGLHGLTGITDRDDFIRPLISYTRKQIEEYAREHSIPYVNDETNFSSDYTRNYIRNEIMPVIKSRFNDVSGQIERLSKCAGEADEYLFSVCPKADKIGKEYHLKSLFGCPLVLQRYAIMSAIKDMGILQDFETRHIDAVLDLRDKPNNTFINLPFKLVCVKFGDGVIIGKDNRTEFVERDFSLNMKVAYCDKKYFFTEGNEVIKGISFDPGKLPMGCVVRTRKDGDTFKRVNGKNKLLSDFLNEKKLDFFRKNELLVLARESEVYAILGLETSDLVKVTEKTTKIIHIVKE